MLSKTVLHKNLYITESLQPNLIHQPYSTKLQKQQIISSIVEENYGFKQTENLITGFKYFIIHKNKLDMLLIGTVADLDFNFYFHTYYTNPNSEIFINLKNPITNDNKNGIHQFQKDKYIFAEYNPEYKLFNKYIN
jgi:hypothetical protein